MGEVGQGRHPGHRDSHPVTAETAVAQDLPGLHPREGMLDASTDLAVGLVVRLLPFRQRDTG